MPRNRASQISLQDTYVLCREQQRLLIGMKVICSLLAVTVLSSCSSIMNPNADRDVISSSLVEFLYPNSSNRVEYKPEVPLLMLPVNVGLAFIPPKNQYRDGINNRNQAVLLEKVKQSFINYDYINRIEVIPTSHLDGGQGFTTLEQVARLYDVDVMALVSFDQVIQSYENNAALFYWTIIGMYVISGNENSFQTFVDTAVFDMKSKKMLFRAPGVSILNKRTTAIGVQETLSEKSLDGFKLAVDDMIVKLDSELTDFKKRIKEEKVAKVEHRQGYSGGGKLDIVFLIFILILAGYKRKFYYTNLLK